MATRTVTLSRTYIYNGKLYGPGAVELDEAIADALEAKEPKAEVTTEQPAPQPVLRATPEASQKPAKGRRA
jgi:hypothetical protein